MHRTLTRKAGKPLIFGRKSLCQKPLTQAFLSCKVTLLDKLSRSGYPWGQIERNAQEAVYGTRQSDQSAPRRALAFAGGAGGKGLRHAPDRFQLGDRAFPQLRILLQQPPPRLQNTLLKPVFE